jgi:hypothetical protein
VLLAGAGTGRDRQGHKHRLCQSLRIDDLGPGDIRVAWKRDRGSCVDLGPLLLVHCSVENPCIILWICISLCISCGLLG